MWEFVMVDGGISVLVCLVLRGVRGQAKRWRCARLHQYYHGFALLVAPDKGTGDMNIDAQDLGGAIYCKKCQCRILRSHEEWQIARAGMPESKWEMFVTYARICRY